MTTLRHYQTAALDACRSHIRAGSRRLVIVAPTGSGKTSIAAEMIRSAVSRGRRTLFLAHRRELIDQCHGRLAEFGVTASVIRADDSRLDPELPVQVASIQTLVRRLPQFAADAFELIIVDEAHHVRAETYGRILAHFTGAQAVIGLTATPCRKDGRGLAEAFDTIVEAAKLRELIEAGFLVRPRMFTTPVSLSGVHVRQGDYVLGELGERMNDTALVGNILNEWQRHASDRPSVIFATTREHSKSIRNRFLDAGVPAEHLDGVTPDGEREAILERVRTGETQVIVNCMILTEGWDMPAISCCVLARPTKSLSLYLQMAGRTLRPAPGKTDCVLLDHGNCYREHGAVDSDQRWTLTGDKQSSGSGAKSSTKECPECGAVVPTAARVCPECGHAFPVGSRDAEWESSGRTVRLVEVSQAMSHATRRDEFFRLVQEVSQARRRDGQPYRLTAAVVKYREAFGEWPRWSWQQEAGIR